MITSTCIGCRKKYPATFLCEREEKNKEMEILNFEKLEKDKKEYIKQFMSIRHVTLDVNEIRGRWPGLYYTDEIGTDGEYVVFDRAVEWTEVKEAAKNFNHPAGDIPSLYCPWEINGDEMTTAFNCVTTTNIAIAWLEYLNEKIFKPNGIILEGEYEIESTEYENDLGTIIVENGKISFVKGYCVHSLSEISTEELEAELQKRKKSEMAKVIYRERRFIDKHRCIDTERCFPYEKKWKPKGTSLWYYQNGYQIKTLADEEIIREEN